MRCGPFLIGHVFIGDDPAGMLQIFRQAPRWRSRKFFAKNRRNEMLVDARPSDRPGHL